MTGTVIPFPPRLRIVAVPVDRPSPEQVEPALVDHGGCIYRLVDLMARLSSADLAAVEATAPRSAQTAWDEVVRRWPSLADLIAARTRTAD